MEKGVLRIEPNISIRPVGSAQLGTRVEIKNLNSLRALERSVAYEIQRQSEVVRKGQQVRQETVGWDVNREVTFTQRVKEAEDDYRYFPEPDLPPLVIEPGWIEEVHEALPELPAAKMRRFVEQYGLNEYTAGVLVAERSVADYFEKVVTAAPEVSPRLITNWITGELFGLINQAGASIESARVTPAALGELVNMVFRGQINNTTAKSVLSEMFMTGQTPQVIVEEQNLRQVSDSAIISQQVSIVLEQHPEQVAAYLAGRETIARWLFGEVMRSASGKANPQVVKEELYRQLEDRRPASGDP
jgi:aspartyl-tRNA(Asn)/glutamyl-tRNA(Gln) amidotransferase subunit B